MANAIAATARGRFMGRPVASVAEAESIRARTGLLAGANFMLEPVVCTGVAAAMFRSSLGIEEGIGDMKMNKPMNSLVWAESEKGKM